VKDLYEKGLLKSFIGERGGEGGGGPFFPSEGKKEALFFNTIKDERKGRRREKTITSLKKKGREGHKKAVLFRRPSPEKRGGGGGTLTYIWRRGEWFFIRPTQREGCKERGKRSYDTLFVGKKSDPPFLRDRMKKGKGGRCAF